MRSIHIPQSSKDQYIKAVLGGQTKVTIQGIEISWKALPSKREVGEKEREKIALQMAERDLEVLFG